MVPIQFLVMIGAMVGALTEVTVTSDYGCSASINFNKSALTYVY